MFGILGYSLPLSWGYLCIYCFYKGLLCRIKLFFQLYFNAAYKNKQKNYIGFQHVFDIKHMVSAYLLARFVYPNHAFILSLYFDMIFAAMRLIDFHTYLKHRFTI